ncbi:ATP-binding protein [Streptomyces sp. DK15]|uniref:ATP-binding protein n=1 Tax=Streptomyces sp. DK15 TaxID=2957499 RepID=UPI0029A3A093|nr:ATP-binding protein [Streptomyces sp. DK15]MDX2394110.1 ATP-binding protein [Streptomyces sp. DK15]
MPIAAPLLHAASAHAADVPARGPIITGADVSFRRGQPAGGELMTEQDRMRPGQMRRIGSAYLRLWGLADLVDSASVLLTELVTNAFQHGSGDVVDVRLYFTPVDLCFEVRDGGPWVPGIRSATKFAQRGRGLLLVDRLADAWGVSEDGSRVWCVVSRDLGKPEGDR